MANQQRRDHTFANITSSYVGQVILRLKRLGNKNTIPDWYKSATDAFVSSRLYLTISQSLDYEMPKIGHFMIYELQLGTERLKTLIQTTVRNALSRAVIDPAIISGQEIWIQQIAVTEAPIISSLSFGDSVPIILRSDFLGEHFLLDSAQTPRVIVAQNIEFRLATRSGAVFTPLTNLTIKVSYQLTIAYAGNGSITLTFAPTTDESVQLLGGGPAPDAFRTFAAGQASANLRTFSQSIPLQSFLINGKPRKEDVNRSVNTQATQNMELINIGMSLSSDQGVLAIRVEVPQFPNRVDPWVAFFAGNFQNRISLQGHGGFDPSANALPWTLFAESIAFTNTIAGVIEYALHDVKFFDYPPNVSVLWSAPGGACRLTIIVFAQNTITFVGDIISHLELTITIDLSVPSTDTLKTDVGFSFKCDVMGIDFSDFVNCIADLALQFILDSGALSSSMLNDELSLGSAGHVSAPVPTGVSSFEIQGNVNLPGQIGHLRDILGVEEGIVLMGARSIRPVLAASRVDVEAGDFHWNAAIGCPSQDLIARARQEALFDILVAGASVGVNNTLHGTQPLTVNGSVKVLDDPRNMYAATLTGNPDHYVIYVECAYPPVTFFNAPYPCILAIFTSAGTFLATIDPPAQMSDSNVRKLVGDTIRRMGAACAKLKDPWVASFLNPDWLIDPLKHLGPDNYVQLWEVEIPAIVRGGTVTAQTKNKKSQGRLTAIPGRSLSGSFMTARGQTLQFQFRRADRIMAKGIAAKNANETASRLKMSQTLLCRSSELEMGHDLRSIALLRTNAGVLLAVGLKSRFILYDLNVPSAPTVVFNEPLHGLSGIVEGPGSSILISGAFGLYCISSDQRGFRGHLVTEAASQSCVRVGGRWFTSTAEGISEMDCKLKEIRTISRPGGICNSLFSLGRNLVLSDDSGVYVLSSCGSWSQIESNEPHIPCHFETVRVGQSCLLYSPRDNGGSLWTLNGLRLIRIGEFTQDPWFYRSSQSSNLSAVTNRAGLITIYEVAGSVIQEVK